MDQNQDNPNVQTQAVERINSASNVLVTVSANPSVDQLSAAIGLTLLLNKLGKHGTAVFSGDVPPTLEFLQPEMTLEKNTDSLRDFIISLDKSKADKLRYKVEEKVVKIFITPYRTGLSQEDLQFSQGDFNVDVVIALGVQQRQELDQAVISQARILHDATIISINNKTESTLGSINWYDPAASSLCEMVVALGEILKSDFLDVQMATAFLTGIVAESERFSNDKTTARTMTIAGRLMTAGANQQLIATRLGEEHGGGAEPEAPSVVANEANKPEEAASTEPAGEQTGNTDDDSQALQVVHDDNATDSPDVNNDTSGEKTGDQAAGGTQAQTAGKSKKGSKTEAAAAPSDSVNSSQDNTTDPPILDHNTDVDSSVESLEGKEPASEPLVLPPVEGDVPEAATPGERQNAEPEAEQQDIPPTAVPEGSPVPNEEQAKENVNDALDAAVPDADRFGARQDSGAQESGAELGREVPEAAASQSPAGPQVDPNELPLATFPPNLVTPEDVANIGKKTKSRSKTAPPPEPPPMMPPPAPDNAPDTTDSSGRSLPSFKNPFKFPRNK